MKSKTHPIPYKVSEYIQHLFREDFLFEVKNVKEINGQLRYFVEVSKDNIINFLQFNEQGELVTSSVEEAFPPDIHEL
jgi:hypothetical protein